MNTLRSFFMAYQTQKNIRASITQALKPGIYCFICRTKTKQVVCVDCLQQLTQLGCRCMTCALPLIETTDTQCGQCILSPPSLDLILTAYAYTAPLRFLIHHFKYHEGYFLTPVLTELLLDALPENYKTDCIVPVPMHTKRLRERGFHHTLWLAKALSKKTRIPVDASCCVKIKHTINSAQLSAKARQKNTEDSYLVYSSSYRHVTLVDDLTTTGETANNIATLLKKNGVETVSLWCVAKTLMNAAAFT